jgi:hypothetical protein
MAGGLGFGFATALSTALDSSFWPRLAVAVLMGALAGIAYNHYALKRLRAQIAGYVYIHFGQKVV